MSHSAIQTSIIQGEKLEDLLPEVRKSLRKRPRSIVVLDDDPTGTQTVHDVPVITDWTEATLAAELKTSPLFFILTNSRSLQEREAEKLGFIIGQRLSKLAQEIGRELVIISRSDSTLRGHYPNEVAALKQGLGWNTAKELLIPAFFEGGRYTYKDEHYVKEGESFLPASETPFAKDNTFGYSTSNLKAWISEKTKGAIKAEDVASISDEMLREDHGNSIPHFLNTPNSHIVVNATAPFDLQKVAIACLAYEGAVIYRTAASFINAISGVLPKKFRMESVSTSGKSGRGGLLIVGSYVPKTTEQLNYLKAHTKGFHFLEFSVAELDSDHAFLVQIEDLAKEIDGFIEDGRQVVLYTTRQVRSGKTKEESLEIVNKVSQGLVSIVQKLEVQPKFIITKGGITSSDIAVKGLGVKRGMVAGQALDGIPVWLLDTKSKFANIPYIIFPGNVGDETALYRLIQNLT